MKAVITVLGNDKRGIIYNVTKILAESDVNILDISQTILDGYFTMVMIVDIEKCNVKFEELQNRLEAKAQKWNSISGSSINRYLTQCIISKEVSQC